MTKSLALVLFAVLWAGCLQAQLDLLTVRESESIVERIPAVAASTRKGECPSLSVSYWGADQFAIQVRRQCGPTGGQLIQNYTVNRRTGAVTLWGDDPLPVADRAGEAFARQLVLRAQERTLSTGEARCLALEAAKGLPGWDEAGGSISVEQNGKAEHDRAQFYDRLRSSIRRAQIGHNLSVDLATARVRDDETGLDVMSEGLGSLTAKMFALREPLLLTDEDAVSIALQVPAVVAQLRDGCTLSAGGAFRSDQAQVGLACGGHYTAGTTVAVNLETGRTSDANTGKALESAESARLAQQLLERIKRRRAELRKEVDAHCRPE
jgi:hypothetical protein